MKIALWTFFGTLGLALVAVVLNFVGVFAFTNLDGQDIAARLAAELSTKTGAHVLVTCPRSIPEKKGGIDDCEAEQAGQTTVVRLTQDDSRGHFHYVVSDADALVPSPTPSPSPSPGPTYTNVTLACMNAGGDPSQCGCIQRAIDSYGNDGDVLRAVESYNRYGRLPDDLAALADSCRRGA